MAMLATTVIEKKAPARRAAVRIGAASFCPADYISIECIRLRAAPQCLPLPKKTIVAISILRAHNELRFTGRLEGVVLDTYCSVHALWVDSDHARGKRVPSESERQIA